MTHWPPVYRADLDPEELARYGWRTKGDNALVREMLFRDFDDALGFVEKLGHDAVDYHRRPDMTIYELSRVRLTIANRHHAGLTAAEARLLQKVEAVIDGHPPQDHRAAA